MKFGDEYPREGASAVVQKLVNYLQQGGSGGVVGRRPQVVTISVGVAPNVPVCVEQTQEVVGCARRMGGEGFFCAIDFCAKPEKAAEHR